MANEQVKDVLDSTRAVHERAQIYFEHLAERSAQPRAKLLLDYLSNHEQQLAHAISAFEAEADEATLRTWVNSTSAVTHLVETLNWDEVNKQSASCDDLTALALDIDNRVIEVYEDLAGRAEPAWLQEVFRSLLQMEQQEEKQMAIQSLRGMDL